MSLTKDSVFHVDFEDKLHLMGDMNLQVKAKIQITLSDSSDGNTKFITTDDMQKIFAELEEEFRQGLQTNGLTFLYANVVHDVRYEVEFNAFIIEASTKRLFEDKESKTSKDTANAVTI